MKIKRGISQNRDLGRVTRRGRPRGFDPDKALDRALSVFWRKGYEGASLDVLTRAMRINRPSLYAAFGNKQELFRRALDRYAQGPGGYVHDAIGQPTARAVAEQLLRGAAESLANPRSPHGCLMVHGALACGDTNDCVRRELAQRRTAGEVALRRRFERAIDEGDLPATADAADLARFITTVIFGMSVQAAGDARRADLQRVVDQALRAWPT